MGDGLAVKLGAQRASPLLVGRVDEQFGGPAPSLFPALRGTFESAGCRPALGAVSVL